MPEHESNQREIAKADRLKNLTEIRQRLEAVDDPHGGKIDKGILDVVISLNASGFKTTMSDEGGEKHSSALPYVEIKLPYQPYIGDYNFDEALYKNALSEYKLAIANIRERLSDLIKEFYVTRLEPEIVKIKEGFIGNRYQLFGQSDGQGTSLLSEQ